MWQPTRPRKTGLFWLAVAACGGGISGLVIVVVSITLLLVIALSVFVNVDTKSSNMTHSSSSYGNGSSTVPLDVTTAWTGARNQAVVNEAVHIASAIYNCGADGLGTCYNASLIPDAVAYWKQTCPGCAAWQNGNLQCVMLITAAFGLAGQPLPYVGNAITFYTSGAYLNARDPGNTTGRPDWEYLSPLSMPEPGDMIVLNSPFFGGVGHIVIVVDVKPPQGEQPGYVQFAEANGPGSINQEPLTQDASGGLHMQIWQDYTVMCYIRHISAIR